MDYKVLKNKSDKDILDYPIAEARTDGNNEVMLDDKGKYLETERTLKWNIKAGETVKFPVYVADILLNRYGVEDKESGRCLLMEVEQKDKIEKEPLAKGLEKGFVCKYCGKSFKGGKGLALHIAARHEDELKEDYSN